MYTKKNFERAHKNQREISIPVRVNDDWKKLRGRVSAFFDLPAGQRIDLVLSPGSFLEDWGEVHIWIDEYEGGKAGVLPQKEAA